LRKGLPEKNFLFKTDIMTKGGFPKNTTIKEGATRRLQKENDESGHKKNKKKGNLQGNFWTQGGRKRSGTI